ncbi:competence type IV pilus minor pilin ComGF [Streptococcus fryi]
MRLRKIRVRAFSLLECLVALLVIAGSMSVYQSMTQLLKHHTHLLSDSYQGNWLLFCQQFRTELDGTEFVKVENQKLYVQKDKQQLAFGLSKKDDFRKTNASGRGYQPMLYGVRDVNISLSGHIVQVDIVFENGLERSFLYAFEKG